MKKYLNKFFFAIMLLSFAAGAAPVTFRTLSPGAAISDADLFETRQGADTTDTTVTGTRFKTYIDNQNLSVFAATTSAQLAGLISDEVGSGALVFQTGGSITGNAGTATAQQNARLIGNVSYDGTADITPQQIQPASEGSDTTNFPLFVNAASGTAQQPKYNSSFGYNASTNTVTATTFAGNASTVTGLSVAGGKTLTASNTLTLTGTDSSSVAFGAGGTVLYNGGALGTPSSGTATNITGLPISSGVSGLAAGVATFLATPSSANLATALTDENGSGKAIFAAGTLAITSAKTATFNNTLSFSGTDSTTMTFPAVSDTVGGLATAQTWTAANTHNVARTVASATSATLDDINVQAATTTVSGSTHVTTAKGFNKVSIYAPTYSAGSALTIDNAASLYIDNAPVGAGAGPATITNAYALWVAAGNVKFAGTANAVGTITSGTWNGSTIAGGFGGTNNAFMQFSGPAASTKTYTLPNATSTILTDNAQVTVAQGGTGTNTLTNHGVLVGQTTSAIVATAAGTAGQHLVSGGASADPLYKNTYPTYQYLTSGAAATYNRPAGVTALHVVCAGGGAGGGAFATNAGTNGNDTTFNSIVAKGGTGGLIGGATAEGGAGGTGGTGTAQLRIAGKAGGAAYVMGANGGDSCLGFGAGGGQENHAGNNAAANSGGGGGGGENSANQSASGGGGGECIVLDIAAPSATYTYTIGAAANGGAAGTFAGGNGGSGLCIVAEYY